MTKAVNMMVSS